MLGSRYTKQKQEAEAINERFREKIVVKSILDRQITSLDGAPRSAHLNGIRPLKRI